MKEQAPLSKNEICDSYSPENGEEFTETHFFQPLNVELFFSGINDNDSLPPEITRDPRLLEQSAQRRDLYTKLSQLFTHIGTSTDMTEAVQNGTIDDHTVQDIYLNLTNFIESDEHNSRILLYLPFEILPQITSDTQNHSDIDSPEQRFADLYRMEWVRLLHGIEPRANFVDGDILEPGLGEPEQISKAGHLTPELLRKGIITIQDVTTLLEVIPNPSILQSLAEGAIVAYDYGLIPDSEWKSIQTLVDTKIGDIRQSRMRQEEFYNPNSPLISPARAQWLRKLEAKKDGANTHPEIQSNSIDLSSHIPYDEELLRKELTHLLSTSSKIQSHPQLSSILFPGFAVFGSKIKGYALSDADLDTALFFKPQAKREQRQYILDALYRDIPDIEDQPTLLEFWTKQEGERLRLQQPTDQSRVFVGENQIHFVMGSVWVGDTQELTPLRHEMTRNYLDLSRYGEEKDTKRQQLLAQLELDVLQFRLMHKGYRNHYPRTERASTAHSDLIDWESDFWDPGYRQVATKLFLSKVFLPDLSH